jgi:iron complex transport system ATP-binding protein
VNAIEVRDLCVVADGRALVDDVSLAVARGEWVSLLGPNGAGKTTVLRALAGLSRFRGTVRLLREDAASLSRRELARIVALVPQTPVLPTAMCVGDYVLLGRTPHVGVLSREGATDRAAAREALERLELLALAGRPLGSLSGGELQRTVIARALAQSAPILLLDEPTTALDIGHQQHALELVERLRRDGGLTVVAAMHDLTLAGQYGDRVVLVDRGRVVAEGTAREVLTPERVSSLYAARVRVIDDTGFAVVPVRDQTPVV